MDTDAKLRPLYLLKILREQTDENHRLSTVQLCQILKDDYGIDTFRTTIKADIEVLQQAGYRIRVTRSTQNLYNYQEREFDQQEIKTLLDAVQSSSLIGGEDLNQLTDKLYKLAGPFKSHELKRNWTVHKNSLSDNRQFIQIIDAINDAINKHKKIRFRTFTYNVKKDPVPCRQDCIMSPCTLYMDGVHAYVVGYKDSSQEIIHQRIDRIWDKPEVTGEMASPIDDSIYGNAAFIAFDLQGSEIREVEMQVANSLMDEIIDVFGLDVKTYACDQNSFRVITSVGINQAFYHWVFSFQGKMKIREPESVRQEYEQFTQYATHQITNI